MSTFGQRLRQAIDTWWETKKTEVEGRSKDLSTFQGELRKRLTGKMAGTSYQSLLNYSDPTRETAPSPEWISAAAEILNVRAAWLAFDSGAMTEEGERKRLRAEVARELRTERWSRGEELRARRPQRMSHTRHADQLREFDELLDSVPEGEAPWVGDEDARLQLLDGALEFLHLVTLTRRRLVTRHAGGPYAEEEVLVELRPLRDALRGWLSDEEWLSGLEQAQAEGSTEAYLDAALGEFLDEETDDTRQQALGRILAGAWAINPEVWARKVLGLFADHVTGLGTPWSTEDRRLASQRERST